MQSCNNDFAAVDVQCSMSMSRVQNYNVQRYYASVVLRVMMHQRATRSRHNCITFQRLSAPSPRYTKSRAFTLSDKVNLPHSLRKDYAEHVQHDLSVRWTRGGWVTSASRAPCLYQLAKFAPIFEAVQCANGEISRFAGARCRLVARFRRFDRVSTSRGLAYLG